MIYAGLDVSDKTTHVCVVDSNTAVLRRDVVASDPDVLAKRFERFGDGLEQGVLETGPLLTFLRTDGGSSFYLRHQKLPVAKPPNFRHKGNKFTPSLPAVWS